MFYFLRTYLEISVRLKRSLFIYLIHLEIMAEKIADENFDPAKGLPDGWEKESRVRMKTDHYWWAPNREKRYRSLNEAKDVLAKGSVKKKIAVKKSILKKSTGKATIVKKCTEPVYDTVQKSLGTKIVVQIGQLIHRRCGCEIMVIKINVRTYLD